jgi:hypothetical protein
MMDRWVALGALLLLLAACTATVRPPSVDIRPVGIQIGGGGFCPPGQAKKGRC